MKEKNYAEISTNETPSRKRCRSKLGAAQSALAADSRPVTDFLSLTKKILTERFASIIEALAQKSSEGSLPHTKYLFDIGGLREELLRQVKNDGEPSVAELLLAEVKRHRDLETAATVETVKTAGETASEAYDGTEQAGNNGGAGEQL